MRRFHVSIALLMGLVLFLALAFAALRYSSGLVGGVTCLLSLGMLMLAVSGVVYRRHDRRAFSLGFALFGWGYLGMAYQTWDEYAEADQWGLVTTKILDKLEPILDAREVDSLDWISYGDPKTRRIWIELNNPLSMPFVNETPLEDVLKYIRTATAGPGLERGIPIYVEPIGLQEADKTMASPVILNLEGVKLRASLKLLLDQLDLKYGVRDGMLTITGKAGKTGLNLQSLPQFRRVGHCLFALILGCLGGIATRWLYATRDRSEDRRGTVTNADGVGSSGR